MKSFHLSRKSCASWEIYFLIPLIFNKREMVKVFLIIFLLSIQFLFAQKYDNIWVFGNASNETPALNGEINFQTGTPVLSQYVKSIGYQYCNAAVCDSLGNLQLCTNGYYVYNTNNQMIQNGNYMCLGNTCEQNNTNTMKYGYNAPQSHLFLPKGNQKQYYLFQEVFDWVTVTGGVMVKNVRLLYSVINTNVGQEKITKKHQIIINDTISGWFLTSVKHANGKDWWIIMPRVETDIYYRILVTTDSVYPPQTQRLAPTLPNYHAGYAVFTPDGKQYIRYENGHVGDDRIYIYDFDRCTGLLSNPLIFKTYPMTNMYPYSLAISANSKYMYIGLGDKIDQYNISLPHTSIESSRTTVFVRDSTYILPNLGIPEYVSLCSALAPDNKIYFWNGCERFHVIQNPDSGGLACNVQANAFSIPYVTYQRFSFTNYPNFRLGAEPCYPTEIVKEEGIRKEVSVYPNPTSGILQLRFSEATRERGRLYVRDMYGREVASYEIAENTQEFEFDTQKWAEEVYYLSFGEMGAKFVVSR
jgi:hypothetical protein